jgi:hypothetical protein
MMAEWLGYVDGGCTSTIMASQTYEGQKGKGEGETLEIFSW